MKVSAILVDAKGVSRLYRTQVRKRDLGLLVLSALFTLAVIAVVTEPVRLLLRTVCLGEAARAEDDELRRTSHDVMIGHMVAAPRQMGAR